MFTPWATQGSFGGSSDADARCPSVSGEKGLPKEWWHHLRRKSLTQGCHGDCWWRWEARIVDHGGMGFVVRVCGSTRSVRRLLGEKRLHRRLEWRWSNREWGMVALLQRRGEPRRKHGLSAIERLLHVERRGNAETRQRLSRLCSHPDALETSFVSEPGEVPCVGIGDARPSTTTTETKKKEQETKLLKDPVLPLFACPLATCF